jgi:hypothetical protein
LLFYPKNDFTLGAGQSKNLPVKLIANVDFMKLRSNKIQFQVSYVTQRSPELKVPRSSLLKKKTKTSQFIRPHTKISLTLLYPNLQFSLIVENQGYSKRTVKIDLQSIPDGLEIMPKQQTVSLEGLEKQTVEIKIAVRKQNTLYPEFNINATVTDLLDNKIAGGNTLYLVILSHNRQIARGNEAVSGSNFAEISYNENSSGFNYLQLRGNTAFRVTENLKSRFNMVQITIWTAVIICMIPGWNSREKIRHYGLEMLVVTITIIRFSEEEGKFLPNLVTIIRLKFLRWKVIIICTVLISNKQKDLPWWVQNTILEMLNPSMGKFPIYSTMIRALT